MSDRPERLDSQRIADCSIFEVWRHRVRLAGADDHDIFTLRMPDWCTVVAVTEEGGIVLLRQHRHGVDDVMLETPGGMLDGGERPEVAAARELLEETGYATPPGRGALESLGWVHPNPALQHNRIHLFLARGVACVAAPCLDPHERVEVVVLSAADTLKQLRHGTVTHALSALALERAFSMRPELFPDLGKALR